MNPWLRYFSAFVLLLACGQCVHAQEALVAELGCAGCHTGTGTSAPDRSMAPDLTFAGERYRPSYLYSYLRNPVRVRNHIGRQRMVDFRLQPGEAVALTRYLGTLSRKAGRLPDPTRALENSAEARLAADPKRFLLEDTCLQCHRHEGLGMDIGVSLDRIGDRLKTPWIRAYLVSPAFFGVPASVMPGAHFRMNADSSGYEPLDQFAPARLRAVADYLGSLRSSRGSGWEQEWDEAVGAHPDATAARGEQIYRALNCSACHINAHAPDPTTSLAPSLAGEGARVKPGWLRSWLVRPVNIRPFGHVPGSGSRMPDFKLTGGEVDSLVSWLTSRRDISLPPAEPAGPLSAFARAKARALLETRLPCLGCHRLGEQGGRIGPDLSSVSDRLRPAYIRAIISTPESVLGDGHMPLVPMDPGIRDLVTRYLSGQQVTRRELREQSLLSSPLLLPDGASGTAALYRRKCAACHGIEGRGDGFNAAFLPSTPTAHADAAYLSTRPDDTLFDGIYAGSYILNKGPAMPGWGENLDGAQIRALVAYVRELCACEEPAWAADNRR